MAAAINVTRSKQSAFYQAKRLWSRKLLRFKKRRRKSDFRSQYAPGWNVVGVGVGEKVVAGKPTGEPAVKFLVRKKVAPSRIGETVRLSEKLVGLPIDVEEVGTPRFLNDPRLCYDPAQPGISVGIVGDEVPRNAGTLGAIVRDRNGTRYLLSNYHVLARAGSEISAFDVIQPGNLDSDSPRIIGTTIRGIGPMVGSGNRIDAALASITAPVDREVLNVGSIAGTATPYPMMMVEKCGRGTGYTKGYVTHTLYDIGVQMAGGEAVFEDQIAIRGISGDFAGSGDSGSVVLEAATNRAVGLLFLSAGSFAFANPISVVLSELRVVFD